MTNNTPLALTHRGRPYSAVLGTTTMGLDVSHRGRTVTVIYLSPATGQILRPTADSSIGGWTNESGSATNLYLSINEEAASALEYIQSSPDPVNDVCRFKVDPFAVDPNVSDGHTFDYWVGKSGSGSVNLTVRLVQGLSTEIASWVHTNVAAGSTPVTQTLTAPQADAITDHTDLYIEFTASV